MTKRQLFDLTGRTALVTGSSGGLGLAIARGLAEANLPKRVTVGLAKALAQTGRSFKGNVGNAKQNRNSSVYTISDLHL